MKARLLAVSAVSALLAVFAFAATGLATHNGGTPRKALFTTLTGHNEIKMGTHQRNAGDLDGFGTATVLVHNAGTVCFGITVSRLDKPVAAHIHRANTSNNGPIVVTLKAPSTGNPGASSGCVTGVASTLTTELRQHPTRFYVNVHTTTFSGGAVRGQLRP